MMALDCATLVYKPVFATFARPVTVTPLASQPGAPRYPARGIYDTERILIETLDGSLLSETRTILDILETEFSVLPLQDDHVSIPFHEGVRGGEFIVSDRSAQGNAGGEITLRLKRISPPKLIGRETQM
jgi:hypothetical protein